MYVKKCISIVIVFMLIFQCVITNVAEGFETESVNVQMFNINTSAISNTIYPNFKITNTGTSTLNLSDIKVRYYFTEDSERTNNFYCDYSGLSGAGSYKGLTSMVTGAIKKMPASLDKADTYLELGFTNSAGDLLPGQEVVIQCRIAKSDWSNFDQSNDFSFNSTGTTYSDFENAPVYVIDNLIYGVGPGSYERMITSTTIGRIFDGNIVNVPVGTKVSSLKSGLTVSPYATFQILETFGGNVVSDPDMTDVTSQMVVKVIAQNFESSEYEISLSPTVKLTTPFGITWDNNIPGMAKWETVSDAISYKICLIKNEANQVSVVTTSAIEYDFTNDIESSGNGTYKFAVTAMGDNVNYMDSIESSMSSGYIYVVPLSTACDVVSLITPSWGAISDNKISASVSNDTTNQLINVAVSKEAVWKLYSSLECSDSSEIENKTMSLSVGDNIAYIKTTAQDLTTSKVYVVNINRAGASNVGSSSSGQPRLDAPIIVNGKTQIAGSTTQNTANDGRSVTIVTADTDTLIKILDSGEGDIMFSIPFTIGSDISRAVIPGQLAKCMENKSAVVQIKTESATYTLPGQQINIDSILDQLGAGADLKDIKVEIEIAKPTQDTINLVENLAERNNLTPMLNPIEFNLRCTYGDRSINISKFNEYVERTVLIPEGVDPNKLTTGILIDSNGAMRSVPTRIVAVDNKYYAKINSLTNSIYALVWNPVTFNDVAGHWAKDEINDIGSRMIINGIGDGYFEPDREITCAEFAVMIIKALGLEPESYNKEFTDVKSIDWYSGYIKKASEIGIISGYGNGQFGPDDKITREQAMVIIARIMKTYGLEAEFKSDEAEQLLTSFIDLENSSDWAMESINECVEKGIVTGKSSSIIAPHDRITRAEAAAIIHRLLQKTDLI